MQPKQEIENSAPIEAVVGVFDDPRDSSRVAASLRSPQLQVQRISRNDPIAAGDMPQLVYDNVEEIGPEDAVHGLLAGGAIGAGSGLLFLGVPGLNVAAPVVGLLAGAWIGGVAGIDETARGIALPNADDYRQMLADGKSFVVIAGDESQRIECEKQMWVLGALQVHQHPPVLQAVRAATNQPSSP